MFDAFFDSYAKESKQNGPQKNALHSLPAYTYYITAVLWGFKGFKVWLIL